MILVPGAPKASTTHSTQHGCSKELQAKLSKLPTLSHRPLCRDDYRSAAAEIRPLTVPPPFRIQLRGRLRDFDPLKTHHRVSSLADRIPTLLAHATVLPGIQSQIAHPLLPLSDTQPARSSSQLLAMSLSLLGM